MPALPLSQLLQASAPVRTAAEEEYRAQLRSNAYATLRELAVQLQCPIAAEGKMASVLLRRALEDETPDGNPWAACSPDQSSDVATLVLQAVQSPHREARRAALAPIAQLAKLVLETK